MRLTPEEREELVSDRSRLKGLVMDAAWKEVVVPILEDRCRELEQAMATNRTMDIEQLRYNQGQHVIWKRLLNDPMDALYRTKREG